MSRKRREDIFYTVTMVVGLIAFGYLAVKEPILPDAKDCAARGQEPDCWKRAQNAPGAFPVASAPHGALKASLGGAQAGQGPQE